MQRLLTLLAQAFSFLRCLGNGFGWNPPMENPFLTIIPCFFYTQSIQHNPSTVSFSHPADQVLEDQFAILLSFQSSSWPYHHPRPNPSTVSFSHPADQVLEDQFSILLSVIIVCHTIQLKHQQISDKMGQKIPCKLLRSLQRMAREWLNKMKHEHHHQQNQFPLQV